MSIYGLAQAENNTGGRVRDDGSERSQTSYFAFVSYRY
jgi:hypothetical protein